MKDAGSPRARPFENTLVYGMRMNHPDRRKIDNTLYGNRICMIDRPDWDLRLGYLIHDVSRLRRMMFDRALAPLGITRSQWWVLAFISRKDGLPQTQLANELDVGKVGVGALIDRLESSGFVLRQPDPVDGRVKRVVVTKQARGFLEKLRKETDKFNAQLNRGIDRKALEATSDALLAMKHNLLAMSDGTALPADFEEDFGKKTRPRKGKKAA
jgi:DNA-binding MarR family transcriptional regulator